MAKCLIVRKGHLHNDVILLPRPESRILFSSANFKYEGKNEKDSGHSGKKMTPSCKWPSQKMPIYSEAKCEANDMKIDFIFILMQIKLIFIRRVFN